MMTGTLMNVTSEDFQTYHRTLKRITKRMLTKKLIRQFIQAGLKPNNKKENSRICRERRCVFFSGYDRLWRIVFVGDDKTGLEVLHLQASENRKNFDRWANSLAVSVILSVNPTDNEINHLVSSMVIRANEFDISMESLEPTDLDDD